MSVAELLRGEAVVNGNRAGSMLRARFYACPVCGNLLYSVGQGAFSCCGIDLPPLEPETPDAEHAPKADWQDGELYVELEHPMEKEHFLSFLALVSFDRVQIVKLYPEQAPAARFAGARRGDVLYAFCNRHGLYRVKAAALR